ncbi:MAG: hypothetical protein V7606_849 [Burkholderiales bacterium]
MKTMVRLFCLWLTLLSVPFASAQAIHDESHHTEVTVKRLKKNEQPMFEVNATGFVRAGQQQAWRVLTDYERLQEFVPDLQSSILISRNGAEAIVEQHSEAGFLFLSQTIHMVVRVTEQPHSIIDVALISGDMRNYTARWELVPTTRDGIEGTHIVFSGTMEPDFFVPPLVGSAIIQVNVRRMVNAVLTEINKRGAGN